MGCSKSCYGFVVPEGAATTGPGSTPILDRREPFPEAPRTPRGDAMLAAGVVVVSAAIAAYLVIVRPSFLQTRGGWVSALDATLDGPWSGGRLLGALLQGVLVAFAVVAVHELGHVVGGWLAGYRFHAMAVGPVRVERPFRLSISREPGAWTRGWVRQSPTLWDHPRRRALTMILGGPAANLLTGAAVLVLAPRHGFFSLAFVAVSFGAVIGDLLPVRTRRVVFDGRHVLTLLGDPRRAARWMALSALGAEVMAGVLPESWPDGALAAAVAIRDHSADTVAAHAFAYAAAFHRHRDDEAAALLETCLRHSGSAAPALRIALMGDSAVFQARRRRRADLAEQWLEAIPAAEQPAWQRGRVVAAILEARGNAAGALRQLALVETALAALPDTPERHFAQRLVRRWSNELGDPAAASG
jgi:hypothetical protein